ncbi:MAG TPA: tetratricopeptide repeat protein [Vicinamibacterales bacterium]|nr:tetratricopeptide repeat protein [Vicinamibacterales bacterium]
MPRTLPVSALIAAALAAGCTARPVASRTPALVAELHAADALAARGCYLCLREAFARYERLTAEPATAEAAAVRAFRTAVLLAVRERTLGIPGDAFLARARRLEARPEARSAAAGRPEDRAALLAVAETVVWNARGVPKETFESARGGRSASSPPSRAAIEALRSRAPSDDVSAHVLLVAACDHRRALADLDPAAIAVLHPSSPLQRFASAVCSGRDPEAFDALLRDEPRFHEVNYFRGLRELAQGRLVSAERLLIDALDHIPAFSAAALSLGEIALALEEPERALAFFDRTLDVAPDHREALVGRVRALSAMQRHGDAIASADRLIALGTWHLGEAYYWRAWNRGQLGEIDAAWEDIEHSRRYQPTNADVHALRGLLAWRRGHVEEARASFVQALASNPNLCETAFHLGRLEAEQHAWEVGARAFADAAGCYERAEAEVRRRLEETDRSALPDDRRAALRARRERQIDAAQLQRATAAYNAAAGYFNAGRRAEAVVHARAALVHPSMRADAERLLARIDAKR